MPSRCSYPLDLQKAAASHVCCRTPTKEASKQGTRRESPPPRLSCYSQCTAEALAPTLSSYSALGLSAGAPFGVYPAEQTALAHSPFEKRFLVSTGESNKIMDIAQVYARS